MDLTNLTWTKTGDKIVIIEYFYESLSGRCIYEKIDIIGKNKPIRQQHHILTDFNMENIIDKISKDNGFNNTQEVSMMLRNHSVGLC